MTPLGVAIVGLICAALGLGIGAALWLGRGAFDDHATDAEAPESTREDA